MFDGRLLLDQYVYGFCTYLHGQIQACGLGNGKSDSTLPVDIS
jgi:hypothetical protein